MTGNLRSILAMLAAMGCFSLMDAVLKTLAGSYPSLQVAALRGLTSLPLVCAYVLCGAARCTCCCACAGRCICCAGVLGIAMLALFSFSLRELGLAEAYTIFFVSPLIITVLSIPVLQEKVTLRHWAAIAVGLGGVVVALRPDQDAFFSLGAISVLVAATFYAISAIAGRVLSTHRRGRDPGVLDHRHVGGGCRRARLAVLGAGGTRPTAGSCWRWRVTGFPRPVWPSPRPFAMATRRPWRRSNIRHWPGPSCWISRSGMSCPTATPCWVAPSSSDSGIYLIRKEKVRDVTVAP